ncbi:filamentous hemagglutinin N-terminal domain-containing protein [Paraburkholderia bryophila]|uniref:filamentous hemagglutinin N-terminal domain-containing protein n=1 Tax=Paraburkholderia bryophila TaxID=420952 RepID=UPI0023490749|nr:filamentous hemagglutinin N-terminal domain-containing protein [Paraburkholderia bryophila]WCM18265.1 filamentous hemagglutinin N-terminal domain-containing protein [Paraburkholderia bryophila]
MNASTRSALRQLEQNRQAHDERHDRGMQSARLRWLVPMPARAHRLWQRAVSALVALTLFAGPLSITFEQSRDAAGVLAAGGHHLDDEAWQRIIDLSFVRVRFAVQMAQAAPIVDPTAPITFQPKITQTTGANGGVPVVNITAPNAAGISLNKFQTFNIDPIGLILNNSLTGGTSLTGGNLQANPNLAGRTASVIVNQVTSTGAAYASLLNGPLEVFGAPATVIIANPNGITTNSTGFTNTIGVTLSTGTPQFLSDLKGTPTDFNNAQAIGYSVVGGHIQIEGNAGVNGPGAGIEGTVGTIDLIGETIGINAPLYAGSRINAIAGRQFVLPSAVSSNGTTYATSANGSDNSANAINSANGRINNGLAIDATAFGAMTAGQIQVIGTAAGMGVRTDAQMAANTGDLLLSSNGDLTVNGSAAQQQATLQAGGNLSMTGAHVGINGYTINANGDVTSTGTIQTGGKLAVTAGGNVNLANAQSTGDTAVTGGASVTLGDVQTGGALTVTAQGNDGTGDINLNGTSVMSGVTHLQAARDVNVNGQTNGSTMQVTGQRNVNVNANGVVRATGDLTVAATQGSLTSSGNVAAGGQVTLSTGQDVRFTGALQANHDLQVNAGNSATLADTQVGGALRVTANGASSGDATFNGNTQVVGTAAVQAARDVVVNGTLASGAQVTLSGQRNVTIANTGTVQANGDLNMTAAAGNVTSSGTLTTAANLNATAGQDVALTGSTGAVANTSLGAGRDLTVGGTLAGQGTATLTAGRDALLGGTSGFTHDVTVNAANDLSVSGTLVGMATLTLTAGQAATLNNVQSTGALQVAANGGPLTINGTVTSLTVASLTSGGDFAVNGTLQSNAALSVASGGNLSVAGTVNTLSTGAFNAARDFNIAGTLQTSNSLSVTNGGNALISGTVNSLADASITSGGNVGVNGLLQGVGTLLVTSGGDTSVGGTVLSTSDVTLRNAAGSMTSTGTLQAGGKLLIDAAQSVDLGHRDTTAQGDLTVKAGQNLTMNGTVTGQGNGTLTAGGAIAGSAAAAFVGSATLQSGGDTTLTGSLQGNTVQTGAGGSATLHDVMAASTLSLSAANDLATNGTVLSHATVDLNAGRDLTTSGPLQSIGNMTLTAGRDLNATGALAVQTNDLRITAGNNASIADAQVGGAFTIAANGVNGAGGPNGLTGGDITFNGTMTTVGALTAQAARDVVVNGKTTVGGVTGLQAGRDLQVNGTLASTSQATLDAQRNVGVAASGVVQANGNLAITAHTGNVASTGTLQGAANLAVNGGQDVALTGATASIGAANLQAGHDLTIGGTLAGQSGATLAAGHDVTAGGSIGYMGDVGVTAGNNLAVTGSLVGAGVTLTAAQAVTLNNVQSDRALQVAANGGALTVNGTVTSLSTATLNSAGDFAVNGTLQSANQLAITSGGKTAVAGTVTSLATASVTSASDVAIGGALQSTGALTVASGGNTSITSPTGVVQSNGDLTLRNASGSLTSVGTIQTNGNLLVDAAQSVDLGTQSTSALGNLTVNAGQNLTMNGAVGAQGNGTLNAGGAIAGAATAAFGQALKVGSGTDTTLTGSLRGNTVQTSAGGSATLNSVTSASTLSLSANGDLGTTGAVTSGAAATLNAGGNLNVSGPLQAVGDTNFTALSGSVVSTGSVATNGAFNVQAGTDITLGGSAAASLGMTLAAARNVSATGALSVLAGDLQITAGNNVSLTDTHVSGAFGVVAKGVDGAAAGGDVTFNGTAIALGATSVQAARDVIVNGTLAGGGDGTPGASATSNSPTTVQAGRDVNVAGLLAGGAQLGVTAQRNVAVGTNGTVEAAGDLSVAATTGSVTSTGTLNSQSTLHVNAAQDVSLTGVASVVGATTLNAGHDLTVGGTFVGKSSATLGAGHDATLGGSSSFSGDTSVNAGNNLTVSGALVGAAVSLTAGQAATLNNVQSNNALQVAANGGPLTINGTVASLSTATLSSVGDFSVNGILQSAATLSATSGGKFNVPGAINSLTGGTFSSSGDFTVGGSLQTTGALGITSGGNTSIAGTVNSLAGGSLNATGNVAVTGTLQAAQALDVTSGANTTNSGTIRSTNGNLGLHNAAGSLTSTGTLESGGNLAIDAAQAVDLGTQGTTALGNLTVNAGQNLTMNGSVAAQGNGTLTAGGTIAGGATAAFGQTAVLSSGGDTNLTGSLRGSTVQSNAGGSAFMHDVLSASTLSLAANQDVNVSGAVTSGATATLQAGGNVNLATSGVIQSVGDTSLTAVGGSVTSTGAIVSNGALNTKAGTDINLGGAANVTGNTTLNASNNVNLNGSFAGSGAFAAQAGSAINLGSAASAASTLDTSLKAGSDINLAGTLTSHGGLNAQAGRDIAVGGAITTALDTLFNAGRDINVSGTLAGVGSGSVAAGRDIIGAGTFAFGPAATLSAARDVVQGGLIQGQTVQVTAAGNATVTNITSAGSLSLAANGTNTATGPGNLIVNGTATAAGAVTATAQNDATIAGKLESGASLGLTAQQNVVISGAIQSVGDMNVTAQAGSLTATGGMSSGGKLAVLTGLDLSLGTASSTSAVSDMTFGVGRDASLNGLLIGGTSGVITTGRDLNGSGTQAFTGAATLSAQRELALTGALQANAISATGGDSASLHDVNSATTLAVTAQGNAGAGDASITGTATAAGTATLNAARDVLVSGSLANGSTQTLNAARNISVTGVVQAAGDLNATATTGNIALSGTTTTAGSLNLTSGLDTQLSGQVAAAKQVTVQAGRDIGLNGALAGQMGGTLTAAGSIAGAGSTAFSQAATLNASNNIALTGPLQGGSLALTAGNSAALASVQAVTGGLAITANGNAGGGDITVSGAATAFGALSLQAARDASVTGAINTGGTTTVNAGRNVTLGDVNASGDMALTATSGSLGVGNLTTQGNLTASAGQALTVAGATVAGGNAQLKSGGDMTLTGSIGAQNAGSLNAGGSINAASVAFGQQATLNAGGSIGVTGSVATNGALSATAGNDLSIGSAQAGGTLALQAQGHNGAGDVKVGGTLASGAATTVTAARDVTLGGNATSADKFSATAGRNLTANGAIGANSDVALSATSGNLGVAGSITSQGNLNANAGSALSLSGELVNGNTTLGSGGNTNLSGTFLGLGAATINSGGSVMGSGAALTFGKDITIGAGGGVTLGGIQGAGQFSATSGGDMSLGATTAVGNVTAKSTAGSVSFGGALQSGGNVQVVAANNVSVAGAVSSMGTVNITGTTGNVNVAGVSANGDTALTAGQTLTLSGTSTVAGQFALNGGNVTLSGSQSGSKNVTVKATGTLDASHTTLVSTQNMQLNGASVTLGNVVVGGALTAAATNQLSLVGSAVDAVGTATLTSQNGFYNASNVLAGGNLSVSAPNLTNAANASLASTATTTVSGTYFTNAGLVNGATTTVNVAGNLNNTGGSLMGVNALSVTAGSLNNQNGVVFAGNPKTPNGPTTGDVSLTITGGAGSFYNAGGQLLAQRNMTVGMNGLTLDLSQGTISQGGALSITAGQISNSGTWNYGGQSVSVYGLYGMTNSGLMTGSAPLTLGTGGTFTNYGQVTGGNVTFNGTLNNVAGAVMHADSTLALNGNTTNRGTVEAGSVLSVTGGNYDNQGATTQSKGDVNFNIGGTLFNTGGSIFAGNNVNISAGAVVNDRVASTGQTDTGAVVVNDPAFLLATIVGAKYVATGTEDTTMGTTVPVYTTSAATLAELLSPTGNPSTAAPVVSSGNFTIEGGVVGGYATGDDAANAEPGVVWVLDTPNNAGSLYPNSNTYVTFTLPTVYKETISAQQGTAGVISAGNSLSITTGNLSNQGGQIAAAGNESLNVSALENNALASTLTSSSREWVDQSQLNSFLARLTATLVQNPMNDGSSFNPQDISSSGPFVVAGQGGTIQGTVLHPVVEIGVSSSGSNSVTSTLSSAAGTGMIAAGNNLSIGGGNLVNAGLLYAGNNVIVSAASLTNQGGNQQNYSSQVGCAAGVPSSACGTAGNTRGSNPTTTTFGYSQNDATIYAGNDLVIAAGQINNTFGNLLAGHDIVIGGVGTTASSTTPAGSLNNTSGNIVAGNNITLNVSGAITNNLPPPVPVHENYGSKEQYSGCMTAGGYKESYCEGYVDQQSGSSSVISAGNNLQINAGSLTNIGSLIAAGNSATINVAGPVVNEAQTLNAYWHSHWVQETGMFSSDKRHDVWACGSAAECTALYGSAYTSTGGTIDPPQPVGNIAATIQAPNLSITSGGQIQNVGNVIGTSVTLTGQKLINGITTPNTYTPRVNAPSQVISLSPLNLPGLNLSMPRVVGATLPTPVAGKASYVDNSLGASAVGNLSPQDLLTALPSNLQPSSTLFYYNPQEEDLMLQQAALQQTGKASFIDGLTYDNKTNTSVTEQEKAYLYQNSLDYAKANNLQLGDALTQTQINALDKPMLWYVEQTVPDPSCTATGTATCPTITALMPQVYLPSNTSAMSAGGNISGQDVTLDFNKGSGGSVLNTGSINATDTLTVNTDSLTNQANQVNVGQIWSKVKGGYVDTTGTTVQPGGFMSAANMDINVQTLDQIGGALQKLNADGTVDQAGTQQVLAALQQQLGSNFTQTSVSDNLHTDFVKEGGGLPMFVVAAIAIAASIVTAGAAAAAFGVVMTQLSIGSVLIGGLGGMVGSIASQVASGQGLNFGQILQAGAIGALSVGVLTGTGLANVDGLRNLGTTIGNGGTVTASQLGEALETITERGLVNATINTAFEGGSFGKALESSMIGDVGMIGAGAIGTASTDKTSFLAEGSPGYVLAHAGLGCALSAAQGSGCVGGAIGGATSAIVAPIVRDGLYDPSQTTTTTPNFDGSETQTVSYTNSFYNGLITGASMLAGGALAGAAGQNSMGGLSAAENEALNNTLSPKEKQTMDHAYSFRATPVGSLTKADVVNTLAQLQATLLDPNLTAQERGYILAAQMTAYEAGIRDGVLSATNAGALASAEWGSMGFSGGGDGPLPGGASRSNVLPTTTGSRTAMPVEGAEGELAASKVQWVDENAAMSQGAQDYNDSATGARSNPATQSSQAPAIERTMPDGSTRLVKFDGLDGDVLVDRKVSVVTTSKAMDQAMRQSEALSQSGLTGRWEVPTVQQANRAQNMFNQLGITNITVKVVPR